MKALRAQMNPHFIFNALNSIYVFIQQKTMLRQLIIYWIFQIDSACAWKFHAKKYHSKEDIEALELYMQLEQLKSETDSTMYSMSNRFGYLESVYVPPLILQPFIEKLIWHGFNTKPEKE